MAAWRFGLAGEGQQGDGIGVTTGKKIAIFVMIAAVLGGFVFYNLPMSEPSYQGKILPRWIRGLEYRNVNPSDEQRAALRAMGQPAIDWLIATLQRRDSAIKRKFVGYAKNHADIYNLIIAPCHVIPENIYHAQAATALGEIGPAAQAAIPALTAASTGSDAIVAGRARAALIKIRQESIAPLVALLEDTHSTNWFAAAQTARHLGTNAEAAVPLLVSALQSTNVAVREFAVSALGGIASCPDIAVPALIDCVQDQAAGVRRSAIDALCKFKGAKQQIVPLLLSRMQDSASWDNNVWLGAAFGLEELLDKHEKRTLYVPALVKSLNNPNQTIRANAGMFLKRNDPEAAARAGIK